VESLEQIVERVTPVGVTPDRGPVAALEGRRLEESTVQERHAAEGAGPRAATGHRPVQDTEAEGVKKGAVKVQLPGEGALQQPGQVTMVAVEPALRLHEVEEQHARQRGERQVMPIGAHMWNSQPIGEAVEGLAEGAKETRCDPFGRQHLANS